MGISIWQLLILLIVVALVFGTKKLRTLGGDLGSAIKGFRSAIKEDDQESLSTQEADAGEGRVIDGQVESKEDAAHKA